jgi:hypothetical protein
MYVQLMQRGDNRAVLAPLECLHVGPSWQCAKAPVTPALSFS